MLGSAGCPALSYQLWVVPPTYLSSWLATAEEMVARNTTFSMMFEPEAPPMEKEGHHLAEGGGVLLTLAIPLCVPAAASSSYLERRGRSWRSSRPPDHDR